jgi:hypothetical protein
MITERCYQRINGGQVIHVSSTETVHSYVLDEVSRRQLHTIFTRQHSSVRAQCLCTKGLDYSLLQAAYLGISVRCCHHEEMLMDTSVGMLVVDVSIV